MGIIKALKRALLKLLCKFKGHKYGAAEFTSYTLCYCQRCGKEVADRTPDDLDVIPSDDNWFNDYIDGP